MSPLGIFVDTTYLIAIFYSPSYRRSGTITGFFGELIKLAEGGRIKLFTSIYNLYELVHNVVKGRVKSLDRELTSQELSDIFNACLRFVQDARLELVDEPPLDQKGLLDLGWRTGFRIEGKDVLPYLSFLRAGGDFMLTQDTGLAEALRSLGHEAGRLSDLKTLMCRRSLL